MKITIRLTGSILLCYISTFFASAQNVGIGTANPVARLHVTDSAVLFSSSVNLPASPGNPPVSGPGIRLMWYPQKAAFRIGGVSSTQWDKDNIGEYSFATGRDTKSPGYASFAQGYGTTASYGYSNALGYYTTASGFGSTAIGNQTTAKAFGSFSVGSLNDISDNPDPFSTNLTDRIFQIGNGIGFTWSNAMTVLRNGYTGIGTTNPEFRLDVRNGSINTDSVYRIGSICVLAMPVTSNLFVGKDAGRINEGLYNTFCGDQSGYSNTTGYQNSFFGHNSGRSNNTGFYNAFFGKESGNLNTSGSLNSFFGVVAGNDNADGDFNSFFGHSAGINNITGDYNTALGYLARFNSTGLTNATAIGSFTVAEANNTVRIGNPNVISIGGQVGWTTLSDGRFKVQVKEDVQGLAFIKKLRTVSYLVDLTALNNYYSEGKSEIVKNLSFQENANSISTGKVRQSGFIAQEVEQAAKELGFTFSGIDKPQNEKALYGLRYGDFVVPLVKAVQEQQVIIDEQNKKIEMLINEITLIKDKLK